ncbi:DUF3887 domain-containing protein [Candidatus Sumerlaeota bacterium]|nr:DUF3887 domain-containing protein [Candidatus Sumerlaeota bacterium]
MPQRHSPKYSTKQGIEFMISQRTKIYGMRGAGACAISIAIILTPIFCFGSDQKALEEKARAFIDFLKAKDFAAAVKPFDATMRSVMPPAKLKGVWDSILLQYGQVKEVGTTRAEKVAAYDVIYVLTRFQKGDLEAKLVFNSEAEVSGLFFIPARDQAAFGPPSYADPTSFTEEEFTVLTGEFKLPGKLVVPKEGKMLPIVLLVAGSGPNDMDETIGPNKPFRDIAWGLGTKGIASLRYDKRTKVYGSALDLRTLTYKEEVIDDVISAIKQIRGDGRFDRKKIFILGHSLGGNLVPAIIARARISLLGAEKIPTNAIPLSGLLPIPSSVPGPGAIPYTSMGEVAGAIIMAGSTRPITGMMTDQLTHIALQDGELSLEEKSAISNFRTNVDALLRSGDPAHAPVMGLTYSYLKALNAYDPIKTAKRLRTPLFIAQGERDYQVTAKEDFKNWKDALEGRTGVEFKLYPSLNHLFMSGEGISYPSEYERPAHLSEEFINDAAEWIRRMSAK